MYRSSLLSLLLLIGVAQLQAQELAVSLQTDRRVAYIGEQVLLTLEIKVPHSAFGLAGEEPQIDGIEILSLHKAETEVIEDSIRYRLVSRVFALFASKAAILTLPSLRYQALLPVPKQHADGASGNPEIVAESQPLQLEILAPRAADGRVWLAAEDVSLMSDWSSQSNTVRAGEPVTHHLTVEVRGQHPAAIPEVQLQANGQARLYPHSAVLQTTKSTAGVLGRRQQSTSVIAPAAGLYRFPGLTIDWWDINAGRWRVSELPAQEFQFIEPLAANPAMDLQDSERLGLLAASVIATVSIMLNMAFWRRLRAHNAARSRVKDNTLSERRAWRAVKRSVKAIDSSKPDHAAVRAAVLAWAAVRWPERSVRRLDQLAAIDPACATAIATLDDVGYGYHARLDQRQFLEALKRLRASTDSTEQPLKGLYP